MKRHHGVEKDGRQTMRDGENLNNFLARVFKGTESLMEKHNIYPGSEVQHWSTGNVPAGEFILHMLCICALRLATFAIVLCAGNIANVASESNGQGREWRGRARHSHCCCPWQT